MNHKLSITFFLFLLWSTTATQAQNVGIGTATPIEKLDVSGDLYVRGDDVYFSHDAATNTNNDYFSYSDVNSLPFQGHGMFHFHADHARGRTWDQPTSSISARGAYFTGRIGVGTLNPSSIVHIANSGAVILTLEADTDNINEADNPRIDFLQDNRQIGVRMGFFNGSLNDGNTFHIGTRYNSVDSWTTMSIDTRNQNIGIGTTTPDQRLEINGGGIQVNGEFGIGFAGDIPFDTNVTADRARMYYDNDFIGTYNDFLVIEKTDLNDNDPDGGIVFTNKGADNIRELAMVIRGDGHVGIQLNTPVYALELPNNANVGIGRARANAWVTYSDGRLKSDRKALPYGLATVLQLQPLRYFQANSTYTEKGALQMLGEGEQQIGFIAQDLYQVIPEAVIQPEDEQNELWGVDYTRLVPVLTKAIQEQQAQIKVLEERCNQLEARLKQP